MCPFPIIKSSFASRQGTKRFGASVFRPDPQHGNRRKTPTRYELRNAEYAPQYCPWLSFDCWLDAATSIVRVPDFWYGRTAFARYRGETAPLIRIEHSVFIDRPLDDVFDYLAAPWNMPEWQEAVLEAEPIGDQPIGPDTRVRVRRQFMGQTVTLVLDTTEFQPNERFAFASESGPIALRGLVEVEPHNRGTSVVFTVSGEAEGLLSLAGPFIEQIVRSETVENAARLKKILEGKG